jgi:hypothetical protein
MLKTVGFPSTRTGDQTIVNGNLVIGTAGKGIDFSATSGTGTSELLNDYEEGLWVPTWNGGTITINSGVYTKIGRLVHAILDLTFGASASALDSQLSIPFPCGTSWGMGSVNYTDYGTSLVVNLDGAGDFVAFRLAINDGNIAASGIAGKRVVFDVTYFA